MVCVKKATIESQIGKSEEESKPLQGCGTSGGAVRATARGYFASLRGHEGRRVLLLTLTLAVLTSTAPKCRSCLPRISNQTTLP